MANLKPNQVTDLLRKCSVTHVCAGCPFDGMDKCDEELMKQAAEVIEELRAQVPRWIRVEERKPDKELEEFHEKFGPFPFRVLVVIEGAVISTSLIYDGEDFLDEDGEPYRVVKWRPMPET